MLLHVVAVTRHQDQVVLEALAPAGPEDLPNGWFRVLAGGVADDVLGVAVVEALNEADRPLPAEPVHPAAAALGLGSDAELAEAGAARVIVEYDGTSILVMGRRDGGSGSGFVADEDTPRREVLADEGAAVLGATVRLALDDATG